MPEKSKLVLSKEQKITKPLIEDVVSDFLCGDMKKNALDFIAYLRANKIKPVWAVTNGWKATYKGKVLYYIRLHTDEWKTSHLKSLYGKHSWVVTLFIEDNMSKYEDTIIDEGLQNFIWDNVHQCMVCRSPCHGKMPPHRDTTALGKEIKGICHSRELTWVFDPDETALNCIKRLLELEQNARNTD